MNNSSINCEDVAFFLIIKVPLYCSFFTREVYNYSAGTFKKSHIVKELSPHVSIQLVN